MNNEVEWIWKETVKTCVKALSWYFPGRIKENSEKAI
jgi:hypothetical protein